MRKLTLIVLILTIPLMVALTATTQAANTGDPIDGCELQAGWLTDYYCMDVSSVLAAWQCEVAICADNWFDLPW